MGIQSWAHWLITFLSNYCRLDARLGSTASEGSFKNVKRSMTFLIHLSFIFYQGTESEACSELWPPLLELQSCLYFPNKTTYSGNCANAGMFRRNLGINNNNCSWVYLGSSGTKHQRACFIMIAPRLTDSTNNALSSLVTVSVTKLPSISNPGAKTVADELLARMVLGNRARL